MLKTKAFAIVALSFVASHATAHSDAVPHFDLDMTSEEIRSVLTQPQYKSRAFMASAVEEAVRVGTRNLDWLKLINASRPADQQLQLSSPETQRGIPIDAPKVYSDKTVETDLKAYKLDVPAAMKDILFGTGALPSAMPVDEEIFLDFSKQINKIYDTAGRWKMMQPYLPALAARKQEDVRGVFYLKKETELAAQLADVQALDPAKVEQLKLWLTNICYNQTGNENSCLRDVENLISKGQNLNPFYNKYITNAEKLWNGYFEIESKRSDVNWGSANPMEATVPFLNPKSDEVYDFLKVNIEDEWKFEGWQLLVNFVDRAGLNTPYIEFVPGVTANAQLAGRRIQMDKNMPLTEYSMRWTIRHEFGHTLGFPDCYVEFYDGMQKAMVNYQLDVENLMCSRKGHINQLMFNEFKKTYFRN